MTSQGPHVSFMHKTLLVYKICTEDSCYFHDPNSYVGQNNSNSRSEETCSTAIYKTHNGMFKKRNILLFFLNANTLKTNLDAIHKACHLLFFSLLLNAVDGETNSVSQISTYHAKGRISFNSVLVTEDSLAKGVLLDASLL